MRRLAIVVCAACGSTPGPAPAPAPPVVPVVVSPPPPPAPVCTRTRTGAQAPRLDANGDRLELVPVETWFTSAIAWAGDDLLIVRRLGELGYGDRVQNAIERWSPRDARAPIQRILLPTDTRTLAVTSDGKRVMLGLDTALAIHDLATGAEIARVPTTGRVAQIALAGPHFLISTGKTVTLHDAGGGVLDTFALGGTTPTITRVYGTDPDHPTHHDNILRDSPSWSTAIALDRTHVAIGGSDSKVRLIDRKTRTQRVLSHPWTYTEHRHMGGNPDLNAPLAMRFSDDGKQLVVAYRHGEVLAWSTLTGARVRTLSGACTVEEGTRLVDRYGSQPGRVPTADELAACGATTEAVLSPDGKQIATNVGLVRVRALPAGTPLGMFEAEVAGLFAFSHDGTLAVADIYGTVRLWRAGGAATTFLDKPTSTGPLSPRLSDTGDVLSFAYGRGTRTWNLRTGVALDAGLAANETLVAASDDASRTIVQTASGYELRAAGARPVALAIPKGKLAFSTDGHRVLDIAGYGDFVVVDLDRKTAIRIRTEPAMPRLSDDGTRMLTYGQNVDLRIWDTATGKTIATHDKNARAAAFFHDGKRVAFVVQDQRKATAKILGVTGKADRLRRADVEIALDGWITDIAVAPDDSEVLFALEDKTVFYNPATRERRELPMIGHANRVHYARDGAVIFFEHYNFVEVRRDDDTLSPVGRIHALTTGGYLVETDAHAIAGSPDARTGVVTRVIARTGDVTVQAGDATWDRWVRPEALACMLAGEILTP